MRGKNCIRTIHTSLMVLKLDGNSEINAHVWCNLGYLFFGLRNQSRSGTVTNMYLFLLREKIFLFIRGQHVLSNILMVLFTIYLYRKIKIQSLVNNSKKEPQFYDKVFIYFILIYSRCTWYNIIKSVDFFRAFGSQGFRVLNVLNIS